MHKMIFISTSILYSELKSILCFIHYCKHSLAQNTLQWGEGMESWFSSSFLWSAVIVLTLQIHNFKLRFLFLKKKLLKVSEAEVVASEKGGRGGHVKEFLFLFQCPHTSGHLPASIWNKKKWLFTILDGSLSKVAYLVIMVNQHSSCMAFGYTEWLAKWLCFAFVDCIHCSGWTGSCVCICRSLSSVGFILRIISPQNTGANSLSSAQSLWWSSPSMPH